MLRKCTTLVLIGSLSACGGDDGGGGGGSSKSSSSSGSSDAYSARYTTGVGEYSGGSSTSSSGSRASFETTEYYVNRALDAINAAARYAAGASGAGVLVGVFDTGVDTTHTELAAGFQQEYSFNYRTGDTDIDDSDGHGTHVTGIIAARRDGAGMHGVAPEADFASYAIFGSLDGYSLDEALENAYYRFIEAGGRVTNHSYSLSNSDGEMYSSSNTNALFWQTSLPLFLNAARVADAQGIVTVFAAGNTSGGDPNGLAALPLWFPELEDTWLSVVALDATDNLASFSAPCGATADWCLAAPGTSIVSSMNGGGYQTRSGTSMAAPVVTGSIALLASAFPELSGPEIVQILKDTARDLGDPGVDDVYGNGAIDLENAVAPQGQMAIQGSDTIGEQSYRLTSSYIAGSGPVANSLSVALAGYDVSATDDYGRSYSVPMDVTVRPMDRGPALLWAASNLAAGAERDIFSPLAGNVSHYKREDLGSLSFSATDGVPEYLRLSHTRPSGPGELRLEGGLLREEGALLGSTLSGAFEADTETVFAGLGWDQAASLRDRFSVDVSVGLSRLEGDGILRSADDILSQSLRLGWERSTEEGSYRIGLATPLAITSGALEIMRPTGREASNGTSATTGVTQERNTVDLGGAISGVDLEIGYETGTRFLDGAGRFGLGAVFDTSDPEHPPALSARFAMRF